MSDHHHHHRRQNEFSPDAGRMSVQPEDVELKVNHFVVANPFYYLMIQLIFQSEIIPNILNFNHFLVSGLEVNLWILYEFGFINDEKNVH